MARCFCGSLARYQLLSPEEAKREGYERMQQWVRDSDWTKQEKKARLKENRKWFAKKMRQYHKERKAQEALEAKNPKKEEDEEDKNNNVRGVVEKWVVEEDWDIVA